MATFSQQIKVRSKLLSGLAQLQEEHMQQMQAVPVGSVQNAAAEGTYDMSELEVAKRVMPSFHMNTISCNMLKSY